MQTMMMRHAFLLMALTVSACLADGRMAFTVSMPQPANHSSLPRTNVFQSGSHLLEGCGLMVRHPDDAGNPEHLSSNSFALPRYVKGVLCPGALSTVITGGLPAFASWAFLRLRPLISQILPLVPICKCLLWLGHF
jgi:hypothetical protein